jgi:adenylate cyclase
METPPVQRKLAAIVIADVVGYTRLMEHHESGTHARLKAIRERIVDPLIARRGGRIVKTAGDGMVLEFPSATSALACAIDVQRAMALYNAEFPLDQRIELRVGVNLGDIIVDGTDIAGDGVNVAARLQTLAPPGGICISASVREHVREDLNVAYRDLGELAVKNLDRPLRVFVVELEEPPAARGNRDAREGRGDEKRATHPYVQRSAVSAIILAVAAAATWIAWPRNDGSAALSFAIALLPLSAASGSAQDASLSDALTKDLRIAIGRSIHYAPLVGAGRTQGYSGKATDPRTVARELGARYIVDGEVRRADAQIAVSLQLVDGETAAQLWSTRVSLPEAEAVGDTSPLVRRLTGRLRAAIRQAEIGRALAGRANADTPADLVARGEAAWGSDASTALTARRFYDAALRIDPNYVPALLGRVATLSEGLDELSKSDRERALVEVDSLAQRAVEIDRDNAEAWNARAFALADQDRYESALEASARAIQLDPSSKPSLLRRAWIMDVSGQAQSTPDLLAQARAIDPEPSYFERTIACEAFLLIGRFPEAAEACAKAAALGNEAEDQAWLTAAYAQLDDRINVEVAKKELLRRQPDFTIRKFRSTAPSRHPMWLKQAEENLYAGLRKAGVPES